MQAKRKRERMGELKIVVAGCVAQQEGEQLLRRVPEVDLVMGEHTGLLLELHGLVLGGALVGEGTYDGCWLLQGSLLVALISLV